MCAVRGTSQRAAAPGVHLVRERAGLSSQEHAATGVGNDAYRRHVPALFASVHRGAAFSSGPDVAQALHQVPVPLGQLLHVPLYATASLALICFAQRKAVASLACASCVAVLLILASQRIETAASVWGGTPGGSTTPVYRRGSGPSPVEWLILAWVSGQFSVGNSSNFKCCLLGLELT